MDIYLSRHARNRVKKFRISPQEVRETIDMPDFTEPSEKGRQNAWKKKGNRYIRVTYLKEEAEIVVITVTLKERPARRG